MRHGLIAFACLVFSCLTARADEQMRTLAISGAWIAMAHSDSMTSPPDVCMVASPKYGLAFRAQSGDVEFRVINEDWSLPVNVSGLIQLNVGSFSKTLDIGENTDKMVGVELPEGDIPALFTAMDKVSSMTVTVGKSKPLLASLFGSTKATNAFRTCAGIQGNAPSAGSNPFQ